MKLSPTSKIAIGAFIAGNITMYLYMSMTIYRPIENEMKRIEDKKEQFRQEFKARENKFMMNSKEFNKEWKRVSDEQKKRMDENAKARKEWDQKFDHTREEIIKRMKEGTYFKKGGFKTFSDEHEKLMKSGKEHIERGSEKVRQDTQKEIDLIEDKIDQTSQTPFMETMAGSKISVSPQRSRVNKELNKNKVTSEKAD
jgi:hypothetical protein